jgi:hypothetical protein
MGVSVNWLDKPQRVLCQSFEGQWAWAEYDASIVQMEKCIRATKGTVHIIADVRLTAPQVSGLAWSHFRQALYAMPENTGLIVICGPGFFATKFFLQLARLFPTSARRVSQVQSEQEADALFATYAA